jgi:outer membrane usher protein
MRGTASGALVAVGGRMFATPPIDNGFALVRVPGLAGVPILRENQVVGRTDAHGDLLVRQLLPFQPNKIALDQNAVPADYDLKVTQRNVKVARNTGTLVTLEAIGVRAVTGHFRYAGGAAGDVLHIEGEAPALVGGDGLFYVDALATGAHVATIERETGSVRCTMVVPETRSATVTDLGDIACEDAQ